MTKTLAGTPTSRRKIHSDLDLAQIYVIDFDRCEPHLIARFGIPSTTIGVDLFVRQQASKIFLHKNQHCLKILTCVWIPDPLGDSTER